MPHVFKFVYARILALDMQRILLLTLFTVLAVPKLGFTQPDSMLHATFAKRYAYIDSLRDSLIVSRQDSIHNKEYLNGLIKWALKNNDEALAYQLKFNRLYVTEMRSMSKLERHVLNDIIKAQEDGYLLEAADGYYKLALEKRHASNKAKAIEYALSGYELSKNLNTKEFPPRIKHQHTLAIWYYNYKEFNKAKQLILELKNADTGSLYSILGPNATNTLALAYNGLGMYDSAIYYFSKIYKDESGRAGGLARGLAAANTGSIYFQLKNYDKALPWFKKGLQLSQEASDGLLPAGRITSYLAITDIYIEKGQLKMAQLYMDSAINLRARVFDNYKRLKAYYHTYTKLLKASGKTSLAVTYLDSVLMATDSVTLDASISKLREVENIIVEARHDLDLEKLSAQRQKSIWIRNSIIVLIFFLSLVILLLLNSSRLKHKQKELLLEGEKNKAQANLLVFTKKLQDKNRQLAELQEELTELSTQQDIAAHNELIYQLQQATIITEEEWTDFRKMFEQVHAGYIIRVKATYPTITPAEIRYMVLVMLDMNTKEIANVLGISTATVRNQRHRMRKKFNVAEEATLETFIKNL